MLRFWLMSGLFQIYGAAARKARAAVVNFVEGIVRSTLFEDRIKWSSWEKVVDVFPKIRGCWYSATLYIIKAILSRNRCSTGNQCNAFISDCNELRYMMHCTSLTPVSSRCVASSWYSVKQLITIDESKMPECWWHWQCLQFNRYYFMLKAI